MSYRFIFGGAGSGKTYRALTDCIAASQKDAGSRFFILVPEQVTTWAERELITRHPCHATDTISVTSFNRLAFLVFEELGIHNPAVLDDISKSMILRRVAKLSEDSLTVWKHRFDSPGFIDNLKSMISELNQYGLAPDFADEIDSSVIRPGLKDKLHDLKLIYRAFREYIEGKAITREDIPDILAGVIDRSTLIRDAVIILDGFTGFTPVQYKIIQHFLENAREVIFTVTIEEDAEPYAPGREEELFYMSKEMTARIVDLASRSGISRGADIRLCERAAGENGEILSTASFGRSAGPFMKRHFLRYDGAFLKGEQTGLRIIRAQNREAEAAFIASDIARQVRNGFRYRDIAVITANPESYREYFRHEFALENIPFYMDENLSLIDDPLPEMLDAALSVISSGYTYESLIRFLKSGLVSSEEEMIHLLDLYMYECGKRGYARMRADWTYIPAHLQGMSPDDLNRFKNAVLDLLEDLKEACAAEEDRSGRIAASLITLMEKCDCRKKLELKAEEFQAAGLTDKAREYSCVYDEVVRLLRNMAELFAGEKPAKGEFEAILRAGVSQISIGMLPSGLDRVQVGDIIRSRPEHIKLLYVAGANEGSIPRIVQRGSVITDYEKEQLKAAGLKLAATVREDLYTQRFYLYRMFLKPTHLLTLSLSGKDEAGRDLSPSYIIQHLQSLFPDLKVNEAEGLTRPASAKAAVRKIAGQIQKVRSSRRASEDFKESFAFLKDGPHREEVGKILSACLFSYTGGRISPAAAKVLYTDTLHTGVSGLSVFADCPYAYFVRYGLKLSEPEKYSFENVDIGNIIHSALETVLNMAKGRSLSDIGEKEQKRMVEEAVNQAVMNDPSAKYSDTARNRYLIKRLKRITARSVWAFSRQEASGAFSPYELEWKFSSSDGLDSVRYDLGEGRELSVIGRIDRVDICALEDGQIAVEVRDYKTGSAKWSLEDILRGQNLQTVIYMDAAREMLSRRFAGRKTVPAAMLISNITDPLIDLEDLKGRSVDEALLKELAPSGVINSEYDIPLLMTGSKDGIAVKSLADSRHMEMLTRYAGEKARSMGKAILDGDIRTVPEEKGNDRTSCTWCRYRSVCGFDEKIEGYHYSHPAHIRQNEAWEEIERMDQTAASGDQ